MRGRTSALKILLTADERDELQGWLRRTTLSAGLARRACVILMLADGCSISQAARGTGMARRHVTHWAKRFLAARIAGLADNPLARLHKADEHGDRRRNRRALTEDEITRLLRAAELRPIAELGRESVAKPDGEKSGRSTWTKAELTFDTLDAAYQHGLNLLANQPERIDALMFVGRQRGLMYRMMICTGLRKRELASITVGQTHLDGQYPNLELLAKDEKAGRGAMIPLRADLVEALHAYIDDLQARAGGKVLRHDTHLFPMPKDMIRVFDRDLAAASIPKRDERDRVVDLHALRHTFGTHLARAGVAPRIAMAAMRHSSLDLTMNVYTDPALLDAAGAVEALPAFGSAAHEQRLHAATA